jgi:hypothetical protein
MKITVTRGGRRYLEARVQACADQALILVAASGEGFSLTAAEPHDGDSEVSFGSGQLRLRGDLVGLLDNSAIGLSTAEPEQLVVRLPQPYPFGSVEEIVDVDPLLITGQAGTDH